MIRRRLEIFTSLPLRLARPHGAQGAPRRARRQRAWRRCDGGRHEGRHQRHGPHRAARAARRDGRRASRRRTIRARGNRLDVVHVNEIKGGAAATAHLLEFDSIHGRWHELVRGRRRARASRSAASASASAPRASPGDVAWGDLGCDIVLECTGKFLKPEQLKGYFERGVKRVIVAAPVKDDRGAQRRGRRQRPPLRPGAAPAADRGVLHDQLPGAGGQGGPRGDRHPPRPDHHHPRSDQHQRRRRRAAQGPAPRALGHALAAADHDRQRHGDRADLSGAEGQAERPRRARAGAQRQPHRLRVRAEAPDHGGRGERAVRSGGARARWPASSATRRGRWSRPTTATTPAARSSMRRARW